MNHKPTKIRKFPLVAEIGEENLDLFTDAILNNASTSTAIFLCKSIKALRESDRSATDLAGLNSVTVGAALYQLDLLEFLGYVERQSYRRWSFGPAIVEIEQEKRQAAKDKFKEESKLEALNLPSKYDKTSNVLGTDPKERASYSQMTLDKV